MCINCWEEYGAPEIVSDGIVQAAALVDKLYEQEPTGGAMHIVTDDWNLEDNWVESCLADHPEWHFWEPPTAEARAVGEAFAVMTEAERASALAIHEGFFTP